MSLSAAFVNFILAHDGRKKMYSDPAKFEAHLEQMRMENSRPYVMPEEWDFEVPTEKVSFDGHDCYILNGGRERAMIYLHGGSAIHQMLKYHYRFIKKVLKSTDITVYLPIYPLAPAYTYEAAFKMLDSVYDMVLEHHDASRITVMGDSMGGNLALAFPQTLVGKRPM
ncbi:MAG: alpha/beta hydrolase, partial [Candidatus Methanomethylophilaceae archaeon]|nr:alpha/beta hydrolase [Candidatus Methanomethylophilaceae archaeon]